MTRPTPSPKGLLTVKQAAAHVPCSESTIKRRIRSGELPAKTLGKSGRKYYIQLEDLEATMVTSRSDEDNQIEAIASVIASKAPALSAERKAKLASLLS